MADDSAGDKSQERNTRKLLPNELSFGDLKEFTDNFSEARVIGDKKARGLIYKGVQRDDKVISVKRLDQDISPLALHKEFYNKVQHIMALKHENIVDMVAFCRKEEQTMVEGVGAKLLAESFLCYEYLPKGSLDQYIFGGPNDIGWETRFKIIEGICHGLRYLHTLDVPILHMDLKPDTTLLDENMSPKIADFGLARFFGKDETRVRENKVVGSYGYIAPEYLFKGEISTQSDIYSLGILILEITTGEKNAPAEDDRAARKYIDKIREKWTLERIAAAYETLSSDLLEEVKVCIEVGLDCVQIENTRRPSIDTIVDKLTERRAAC